MRVAINVKTLKKIKQFGRLRFAGNAMYSDKVMIKIYRKADEKNRELFEQEMDTYLQGIADGKLQPGDSALKLAFSDQPTVVEKVKPSEIESENE